MARAAVETLASNLTAAQAIATEVTRLYDDIVFDWGSRPIHTNASLIATVIGTSQYSYPTGALTLLTVLYDDKELDRVSLEQLRQFDPDWRQLTGPPKFFTTEGEAEKTFRVIPSPSIASGSVAGGDLASNFIRDALTAIYTEDRADVISNFELPLALEIAGRELASETDHKDVQTAAVFKALANITLMMAMR